jgi:hypothetical protein
MKKVLMLLTAVFFIFTVAVVQAATKDEKRLEVRAAELNRDAGEPAGEKVVTERIEKEFGVDEARVKSLRDKGLGYGEVAISLSLAKTLPGGITDENVDKVLAMRQGPPKEGWGNIAKKLGVKLGPVVSGVDKVRTETRKELKKTERERVEKEKMEKGGKMDKMEHGKPERMERPEAPHGMRK